MKFMIYYRKKKSNLAWLYEIGKQWKGTYTFNLIKLAAKETHQKSVGTSYMKSQLISSFLSPVL